MRTFGRVLAGLGMALAGVGGVGAIAMLPSPVLENFGSSIEERRQALRAHLPDMPDLGSLIAGTSGSDCAEPGSGETSSEAGSGDGPDEASAACAEEAKVGVMRGGGSGSFARSSDGGGFLRPPPAAGQAAGN